VTSPLVKYQIDLKKNGFVHDASQEVAVKKLQDLYDRLLTTNERKVQRGRLVRFAKKVGVISEQTRPEKGLYFWGGVGRGKTYLMDTFFECLPVKEKMRVHFHRFMQLIHQQLNELKGEKNPLQRVADRLQMQARIICFDEFFVTDIGDAMILGTLLEALFSRGVCLVCTSNIIPDNLYQDGLQRQRFLPAIALLNEHTEVVNIDGDTDYRLRSLEQAELYYTPLGAAAEQSLQKSFRNLALEDGCHGVELMVNGRSLCALMRAEDVIWFDFKELCDGPRSQNDYIELAREFHAVLVSNLPVLTADAEDMARRFISLVDEFYDRRVKMIISAAAPIGDIYQGHRLRFEFERTESRLLEMQSQEYQAAEHRA
jgi:cell division protein ZapE